MFFLAIHLFAYAAVCGFLTAAWALTEGSFDDLSRMTSDPGLITELGFWPVWVILGWAAVWIVHLGVVVANLAFGAGNVRKRRAMAREVGRAISELTRATTAAVHKAKALHEHAHGRSETPAGPVRRWVTVMFTDVAGSTALNERLGDDAWSALLAQHRQFVSSAFLAHGGEIVGTSGDGCLARFPTPRDAVACAVDIQQELHHLRATADVPLHVRIGVHAGEALEDDGDLIGRVVNLAARVTDEASADEILVTEPVADELTGDHPLDDRGLHPLRGVSQARHLLAVKWAPPAAADVVDLRSSNASAR